MNITARNRNACYPPARSRFLLVPAGPGGTQSQRSALLRTSWSQNPPPNPNAALYGRAPGARGSRPIPTQRSTAELQEPEAPDQSQRSALLRTSWSQRLQTNPNAALYCGPPGARTPRPIPTQRSTAELQEPEAPDQSQRSAQRQSSRSQRLQTNPNAALYCGPPGARGSRPIPTQRSTADLQEPEAPDQSQRSAQRQSSRSQRLQTNPNAALYCGPPGARGSRPIPTQRSTAELQEPEAPDQSQRSALRQSSRGQRLQTNPNAALYGRAPGARGSRPIPTQRSTAELQEPEAPAQRLLHQIHLQSKQVCRVTKTTHGPIPPDPEEQHVVLSPLTLKNNTWSYPPDPEEQHVVLFPLTLKNNTWSYSP
ncbi:unnamed protein product [Arctogadus glacialis]